VKISNLREKIFIGTFLRISYYLEIQVSDPDPKLEILNIELEFSGPELEVSYQNPELKVSYLEPYRYLKVSYPYPELKNFVSQLEIRGFGSVTGTQSFLSGFRTRGYRTDLEVSDKKSSTPSQMATGSGNAGVIFSMCGRTHQTLTIQIPLS
jgi:hypothetical protein